VRALSQGSRGSSWLCRCVCGAEVPRVTSTLRGAARASRCSRHCRGEQKPARGGAQKPPLPLQLNTERNRERYVLAKLEHRRSGVELPPFPDLTCAECPEATRCAQAFHPGNVGGECVAMEVVGG
ncbi:MAG TPA: hypothetical protein VLC09_14715, partial [Polyangiaceae bacterium]|nr:hypothetical protein [Polyangiaceae bacterium]